MSTEPTPVDRQQARMREFMSLLPLTIEIAGLTKAEHGRYFNPDQMEVRANTLRTAYKIARQLVVDMSKPAEGAS